MKRLLVLLLVPLLLACSRDLLCPAGEVECGGRCVSLLSDAANCGACGTACGPLAVCAAGACGCAAGATACGDACVALESDPAHCGACEGAACAAADVCSAGGCAAACADGLSACGRACVDFQADRFNCGGCGIGCAAGQACRAGACQADLQVACFSTNEVRSVTADLVPAGPPRLAGAGPIGLAVDGGRVYAANSLSHSLSVLPLDARLPGAEKVLAGDDFENVVAHEGLLFVSSSGTGTLVVYDPSRDRVLDEIVLGDTADVNPRGVAFAGDRAYVALYGKDESSGGQGIAVVDLSGLAACAQDASPPACGAGGACDAGRTCRDGRCVARCGTLARTLPLRPLAGVTDASGLPFPSRVVELGGKLYVSAANLRKETSGPLAGYYVAPAGPSRLVVVDPARGDALEAVPLRTAEGDACENAGALAVNGATVWVSCASMTSPGVMPVDVSGAPSPGALRSVDVGAPGNLAFCGGMGYLTDLWSGQVLRFDPAGATPPLLATVCPLSGGDFPWAWSADVACAP
jgi:hypothetical protein